MARILIGNIKGPQGAKGDKGDKGDTGPQGPAGPQGATGPMPALVNGFTTTEAGIAALDAAAGKTLKDEVTQLNSDKLDKARITIVSGLLSSDSNQAFNIGGTHTSPPYLIAAQIQMYENVWSDMRSISAFQRIDNNNSQISVVRESAEQYANYQVRFAVIDLD